MIRPLAAATTSERPAPRMTRSSRFGRCLLRIAHRRRCVGTLLEFAGRIRRSGPDLGNEG
jgi:hypothetical protein